MKISNLPQYFDKVNWMRMKFCTVFMSTFKVFSLFGELFRKEEGQVY